MTLSSNYTKSYATFTPLKKVARLVTIISGKIGTLRRSKPARINRAVIFHDVGTQVVYLNHPQAQSYYNSVIDYDARNAERQERAEILTRAIEDYGNACKRKDTRAMHTTHKALVKARADILEA